MMVIVDDSLVFAYPIPNGFTWTLASRLGQILEIVENEFGPRDKNYTILGVEFRDGVSQTWFPKNCGNVVIQLSREAMQDPVRALFQLAHESVHLLNPCPGGTNVLEEGAATSFSLRYITQLGYSYGVGDKQYEEASRLVEGLVGIRPDALKVLRRLHGPLRGITAAQIQDVSPKIEHSVAERLTQDFQKS